MNQAKTQKILTYLSILLIVVVNLYLLVSQFISTSHVFQSDMPAHVIIANNDKAYSLYHLVGLVGYKVASSVVSKEYITLDVIMILSLILSQVFSFLIIKNYFEKKYENSGYTAILVALALEFVSMIIYNPASSPYLYLGNGTPNPWHNPTYTFAKPFSLCLFLYAAEFFENLGQSVKNTRTLIWVALFAVFSVAAKPSFMLSLIPTLGIMLLFYLVRRKIKVKDFILLPLSFVPSMFVLLFINYKVYHTGVTENTVIVSPGAVWYSYTNSIVLSILSGALFPLFVIFFIKSRDVKMVMSIINYVMAILVFYLFSESGDRFFGGNFGWTYLFGLLFIFLSASEQIFFKTEFKGILRKVAIGLFVTHLLSGILYLKKILTGASYL